MSAAATEPAAVVASKRAPARPRTAKKARPFERLTINLPNGPVLGAIRREAEGNHLSLSQAGLKALERGVRRAPADIEDRLLKLERSLRDHMRLTARDFALTQELVVGVARVICERLPPRDQTDAARRVAERDVEALLARVISGSRQRAGAGAAIRQDFKRIAHYVSM